MPISEIYRNSDYALTEFSFFATGTEKYLKAETELVNVEVCNAPQIITNWLANGKTYVDSLKPFAGRIVIIEFLPDAETRRAAVQIGNALRDAQWDIRGIRMKDGLRDGLEVQPYDDGAFVDSETRKATEALKDFLHLNNWQAREFPLRADREGVPRGAIRIEVGLYPATQYVGTPALKEPEEAENRSNKARDEAADKTRPDIAQIFAGASPEDLKKLLDEDNAIRAGMAKRRAEFEKMALRDGKPCDPITAVVK